MKFLVVLFALVAMVAADCGPMQRLLVKAQWNKVYGTSKVRDDAGHVLWKAIFNQDGETRALFNRVHGDDIYSPEFMAHSARVLGGLDIAISLLDNQAELDAVLAHLKEQHIERGIPDRYFDLFKNALMEFAPSALGRCFIKDAWSSCFDVIANGIKGQ
uniref:Extracellular globin n=1 Tax=Arenicola marina TaxID=6344 RepID=Q2PAD6_AREMA|nr:haemoglobin A2b chain precursor [Arenicola marina]